MTGTGKTWGRVIRAGLLLAPLLFGNCARAPSFDVLGSFFPAWLVCLVGGILLTVIARWLLLRLRIAVKFPILAYSGLTAFFTFALWLIFFH
jgi:YtcA family